jgi:hypothetical protein
VDFWQTVAAVIVGTAPLDLTIVTFAYLGWRTGNRTLEKLQPVIRVIGRLSPEQIERGAEKLLRWFDSDAETERQFKEAGL